MASGELVDGAGDAAPAAPVASSVNRRRIRILTLVGIVLVALVLRGWAVLRLPLDFDEPIYLQAGFDYADALRHGDWEAVIDYEGTREHPALVKLLYGLTVMALGPDPNRDVALYAGRSLSAVFGSLAALAVGLVSPLAGALLAVHTLVVKYTSQVYLEALPLLASTVAVLAYTRVCAGRDRWFWLSAVALGVAAASKFTYVPVVVVVVAYLTLWERRARWWDLLLYGLVALAVFWLLDPTLWRHPLGRLAEALTFHVRYSRGEHVQEVGYPWYQPLYWITRSPPLTWHPEVFFYFGLDGLITVVGAANLVREWRRRRWLVVWIVAGLAFLLVWPTKWPQYTLVLAPPVCLAAASAVGFGTRWLREQVDYWGWLEALFPKPPLAFWVVLVGLLLVIGVAYSAFTIQEALGRLGWYHVTADSTLLPSNIVYDVLPEPGGTLALATERGLVFWDPPSAGQPEQWVVYTQENSPLPDDRVLALARDIHGALWVGTETGVARYDDAGWETYTASELGLEAGRVYGLAAGSDGRVWVATSGGAAVYNGAVWQSLPLAGRTLTVTVDASDPRGDVVWFGMPDGVSRLETASGTWTHTPAVQLGLAGGGVAELLVDSTGRLWAGTIGDGLGLWDGASWHFYRTSNSAIPFNLVEAIAEVTPGRLWIGMGLPSAAGGRLSEFDGETWTELSARNSGFSGAEPLAIAVDSAGRCWVATRTAGLDVYEPERSR
jgi:4-amino-4-deoxy-L-arabinose transferase-like glycosyltransferase